MDLMCRLSARSPSPGAVGNSRTHAHHSLRQALVWTSTAPGRRRPVDSDRAKCANQFASWSVLHTARGMHVVPYWLQAGQFASKARGSTPSSFAAYPWARKNPGALAVAHRLTTPRLPASASSSASSRLPTPQPR